MLGSDTFEIDDPAAEDLVRVHESPGHYTVRMTPLKDTSHLAAAGFYYCDTLLVPYCKRDRFQPLLDNRASVSRVVDADATRKACAGAFRHGRFHRDFAVAPEKAELRYCLWLAQMLRDDKVFGLSWQGSQAGFFAMEGSRAVLHALNAEYRGQGIAKYLWSAAYEHLFGHGWGEVSSSVSAANSAVVNLYCSLGFRFRNPVDLYHLMVK